MAEKKATEKNPTEGRQKALESALVNIRKQFGEGAVMRLGQNSTLNVEAIPTGSLSLDLALGIGGLPRGRIIEIYGPESSVRPPWLFTVWQRLRKWAEMPHSLMLSTHWILSIPQTSVLILTLSWSSAGHRRAGAGNNRSPCAFRCHRHNRNRLVAALVPRAGDRR